jgi:hypothetical protein
MQRDYALFSFDSNKLHANIIPFFWDDCSVVFQTGKNEGGEERRHQRKVRKRKDRKS